MGFIDKIKALFGGGTRDGMPEPVSEPKLLPAAPVAHVAPATLVEPEPEPLGVDFRKVRVAAGVPPEVHELVVKAQELLRTLPDDTPAATKLRIVQAAFNAFGVSIESIVDAASREVKALAQFIEAGESNTERIRTEGARRVAELQADIAKVNASVEQSVAEHAARESETQDEILRVQPVLMFFSQEKPAIVLDSTDLDEASKPPPRPTAPKPRPEGAPRISIPRV